MSGWVEFEWWGGASDGLVIQKLATCRICLFLAGRRPSTITCNFTQRETQSHFTCSQLEPFLHVGVIVGWLGYLLLLRTVAPHVVAREWGRLANGGFNCEVEALTAMGVKS